MSTAIKHPVPDRDVICNFWHLGTLTLTLYMPNISSLLQVYVLKLHLVKVRAFAGHSVKIHVIFSVRFERGKVDKQQNYMKTET